MAETNFDKKDIDAGKGMAVLSYIIALIPYFAEKKNKYVRFHAVQGMNILIIAVGWTIVSQIILAIITAASIGSVYSTYSYSAGVGGLALVGILGMVFSAVSILIGVLDIIGLVYAAQGQAKAVPLLGKIRIIKK
jgi:uncharacterized membrane protein